jgi:hypothetical protein
MQINKTLLAALLVGSAMAQASAAHAANVLIVQGDFYTPDLRNQLIAAGNTVTEAANYTAASLAGYDAVVQYGNNFVDQTALTSFVSGGGTLVWTPWAGLNFTIQSQLQIFNNGGSAIYSQANPGMTVLDAGDPLLAGVVFPGPGAPNIGRIGGIDFIAGVNQVADWADGIGLLGHRSLGAGHIVGVNMHVITSDTAYLVVNQPWAARMMDNAVNFGGTAAAVPEPSTWAMLILGFGILGAASRKRQRAKASFAF